MIEVQAPVPADSPRAYSSSPQARRTTGAANTIGWQERAATAYQQGLPDATAKLRNALAARITMLTSQEIDPKAVYVNNEVQTAVVTVDNVVFRLRQQTLMFVRPCVNCGVGQFESAEIRTVHDLGHALTAWKPRCVHCVEADPDNWLDLKA